MSLKCSPRLDRCFCSEREPRRAAGPLGLGFYLGSALEVAAGPSLSDREKRLMTTADSNSFLSLDEQISRFRKRGMVIADDTYARQCLSNVPYNRLRGYWVPSKENASEQASISSSCSKFEDVFDLYVFDRKLRLIVMDAIEWVEVAVRAKWIRHMGINYGEFGYVDLERYKGDVDSEKAENTYSALKGYLMRDFKNSIDVDAIAYRENNPKGKEPPIWMAAEAMSFGTLIKFIAELNRPDRIAIAKSVPVNENRLIPLLQNIRRVRNICSHHGRLWSRHLADQDVRLTYDPEALGCAMAMTTDCRRLHNTLVILDYFLSVTFPEFGREWRRGLFEHLNSCPLQYPEALGFPAEWEEWAPWPSF